MGKSSGRRKKVSEIAPTKHEKRKVTQQQWRAQGKAQKSEKEKRAFAVFRAATAQHYQDKMRIESEAMLKDFERRAMSLEDLDAKRQTKIAELECQMVATWGTHCKVRIDWERMDEPLEIEAQRKAAEEAGIPGLIQVLQGENSDPVWANAADTLGRLAANTECQEAIRKGGGIEALIKVLDESLWYHSKGKPSYGIIDTAESAADALRILAVNSQNHDVIHKAGGIDVLITVLNECSIYPAGKQAAAALKILGSNSKYQELLDQKEGLQGLINDALGEWIPCQCIRSRHSLCSTC